MDGHAWTRWIRAIEARGLSPWTPIVVATWVGGLRVVEEHLVVNLARGVRRNPLVWFAHIELFYLALLLCISAWVSLVLRRPASKVIPAVGAGLLLGVLPPIIDSLVYAPGTFAYAYRLAYLTGFPWLLYEPPLATPLGETLVVWGSLLLVMAYARGVGASWGRTLAVGAGHYALIVVFLALLPSAAFGAAGSLRHLDGNLAAAALLLVAAALGLFGLRPALLRLTLLRLPRILLAPALVLVGAALVGPVDGAAAVAALLMTVVAWVFAVHNGFFDRREDAAQGRRVTVEPWDVVVVATLPAGFLLATCAGFFWATLAAVLFLVVAHGYHGDPFRLKCVFPLNYKSEALLAGLCGLAGMLARPGSHPEARHLGALVLVTGGASVMALLKDYKDVAADRSLGVRTVYVVLMARGWSEAGVLRLVLGLVGASLAVPCLWLAGRERLAAAAACGALSLVTLAALPSIGDRRLATGVALSAIIGLLGVVAFDLGVAPW